MSVIGSYRSLLAVSQRSQMQYRASFLMMTFGHLLTTGLEFGPSAGLVVTSVGFVFPATDAPSPSQVTSEGNAASQWQAYLYGPCSGPRLANDTTGQTLEFTTDMPPLALGDYILLDSATQTAYLPEQPATLQEGWIRVVQEDTGETA